MGEVWGAIQGALGTVLAFLYDVIPNYGIAIILLTLLVRVVLLPLAIKQTRSMQEMGKIQPQVKALQKRFKGDRQKLQEETMKLYREHGVNPLGGCLPLVLQLPVFFALFSVLRGATPAIALPADPVTAAEVQDAFCFPAPGADGRKEIVCEAQEGGEEQTFSVTGWENGDGETTPAPPWVVDTDERFQCLPQGGDGQGGVTFNCQSPRGTGHLPVDSDLFDDILNDQAKFLGMHLSCGATQATSTERIQQCAPVGTQGGGPPLIAYYGLIVLMGGSTFFQTRQMQQVSGQQQQAIAKIMPLFLIFISLSIPAGVLVYWVTTNGWQIGQQYFMLRQRESAEAAAQPEKRPKPEKPAQPPASDGEKKSEKPPAAKDPGGQAGGKKPGGRRRARGRKKRRKR